MAWQTPNRWQSLRYGLANLPRGACSSMSLLVSLAPDCTASRVSDGRAYEKDLTAAAVPPPEEALLSPPAGPSAYLWTTSHPAGLMPGYRQTEMVGRKLPSPGASPSSSPALSTRSSTTTVSPLAR